MTTCSLHQTGGGDARFDRFPASSRITSRFVFQCAPVVTVPPPQDPLIGLHLNEYEVLEAIAEGGMGVVYRGVHPLIQKRVAIKVLKLGSEKEGDYEQLVREAQAANSISHQNIVDIFGIGRLPDRRAYIIMEYLEGQALDAYMHGRTLPLLEVVQLLFDICAPLVAAHHAQIIHRDLKPSNVFLCNQPTAGYFLKLLDFGLAKRSMSLDGVTEQTSRATVAGTPDYMAPEQAQGKAVSPRTDLYALGCMGYEMVTGQVPFTAPTPFDVMVAHVRASVPRAAALAPTLPAELDALLLRLMAKEPEDRPESAQDVRELLLPMLESLGTAAGAASGPRPSRSGEFIVKTARASGMRAADQLAKAATDDALLPVAEPTTAKEAPTDAALPKASLRAPVKLVVAGLTGLALLLGVTLVLRPAPPAPLVSPVAEVQPPVAKPLEAPVAAPADLPDELDSLVPLANGIPAPKREVRPAPTEQELKKRLAALEQRLRKATAEGTSADPAALQYLAKYRVQATMADTPAERGKLARQLDQWERLFLSR